MTDDNVDVVVTMTRQQYDTLEKLCAKLEIDVEEVLVLAGIGNARGLKRKLDAMETKPEKRASQRYYLGAKSYLKALTKYGRHMNPGGDWQNRWGIELTQLCENRGYQLEDVLELVDWAARDEFWGKRVMSPKFLNTRLSKDKETWRIDYMMDQMRNSRSSTPSRPRKELI